MKVFDLHLTSVSLEEFEDQVDLNVCGHAFPGEPETRDCPATEGYIEIVLVEQGGEDITDMLSVESIFAIEAMVAEKLAEEQVVAAIERWETRDA